MKKILTLAILHKHPQILLGMKKRGFGLGRWNGFGGKVEDGESIEAAAKREIEEEAGIEVLKLSKRGILDFEYQTGSKTLEVHIFSIDSYEGEPKETEEMKPQWFHISEIPFNKMWPDDTHWLPLFLDGKIFKGRFLFDRPSDTEYSSEILEKELFEVKSF